MAEARNPIGYEKQKLYNPSTLTHVRVATYADMIKSTSGNPGFFVVDNDEGSDGESENQDVLYFWSGIEAKIVSDADIAESVGNYAQAVEQAKQEVETNTGIVEEARDEVIGRDPVRVATFAAMLLLPVANKPRNFVVIADEYQNDSNVPYMWDGVFLYEYGISVCDIQPNL